MKNYLLRWQLQNRLHFPLIYADKFHFYAQIGYKVVCFCEKQRLGCDRVLNATGYLIVNIERNKKMGLDLLGCS